MDDFYLENVVLAKLPDVRIYQLPPTQYLFVLIDEGVPGLVGEEDGGRQEVLVHTVAHQVRHAPYDIKESIFNLYEIFSMPKIKLC